MIFYAQIPVDGQYVRNLLPGYLLVGVGLSMAFVSVSIAALQGVHDREAGLASGLLNTSQQIGGALGVAVAGSIAVSHAKSLLQSGHTPAEAYVSGYALSFWVIAAVSAVGTLIAWLAIRPQTAEEPAVLALAPEEV
jgi:MFS family permease